MSARASLSERTLLPNDNITVREELCVALRMRHRLVPGDKLLHKFDRLRIEIDFEEQAARVGRILFLFPAGVVEEAAKASA